MSWSAITVGLSILFCVGGGMILGAWIAARGFEKSMSAMINDSDAPWNKEED